MATPRRTPMPLKNAADYPPLASLSPSRLRPADQDFKAPKPPRTSHVDAAPLDNEPSRKETPGEAARHILPSLARATTWTGTKALYWALLGALLKIYDWIAPGVLLRWASLFLLVGGLVSYIQALFYYYVKPRDFDKIRNTVAQLNPRQRELYGIDPVVSQLVDAVTPRRPMAAPSTARPPATLRPRQVPATPATAKRIRLPPRTPALPAPACVPQTSDVRYAASNSIIRQQGPLDTGSPALRPLAINKEPSNAPRIPLNIAVKPVFQTYQMSSAPTPEEQVVAGPNKPKHVGVFDTLAAFGVDEADLSIWVENMREWLSAKIFHPLAADMYRVEEYLQKRGWAHLSLLNHVPPTDNAIIAATQGQQPQSTTSASLGLFGGFGKPTAPATNQALEQQKQHPTSLNALAIADPNEPLAKLRILLERYLYLATYPATIRGYMLHRITQLASGSALAAYRWDAGGMRGEGKPWTTALPTDAELVMHVFATWIDIQMPGSSSGYVLTAPFSTKYFVGVDETRTEMPDYWYIQMVEKNPPHFKIAFRNTHYDVFAKRNNLFATLALFVLKVKQDYAGYIDMLDIGGKVLALTSILETED